MFDEMLDQAVVGEEDEMDLLESDFYSEDSANTAKVRIFVPAAELPFAGHPTIGCAIHLAEAEEPGHGDFDNKILLEEEIGLVPVTVSRRNGLTSAQFVSPVVPSLKPAELPSTELAVRALGVDASQIGFEGHAPDRHG